jgi:hypothetical protein
VWLDLGALLSSHHDAFAISGHARHFFRRIAMPIAKPWRTAVFLLGCSAAALAPAAGPAPGVPDVKVVNASSGPVYLTVEGGAGNPGGLGRGVVELLTPGAADAVVLAYGGAATSGYPNAIGGDAQGIVHAVSGSFSATARTESWAGGPGGNALAESIVRAGKGSYAGAQAVTGFRSGGSSSALAQASSLDMGAMPRAWALAAGTGAASEALARGAQGATPDARAEAFGLDVRANARALRSGDLAVDLRNAAGGNVAGPVGLDARATSVLGSPRPLSIQGDVLASANVHMTPAGEFLTGRHGFGTIEESLGGEVFVASTELLFHTGTDARLSMALLGLVSGSARLDQASMTILVDGVEIVSRSFASLGEFASFLGSGTLDLGGVSAGAHAFMLTTQVIGAAQFGYTYALSGVSPVPEPSIWLMCLAGLALLGMARRHGAIWCAPCADM